MIRSNGVYEDYAEEWDMTYEEIEEMYKDENNEWAERLISFKKIRIETKLIIFILMFNFLFSINIVPSGSMEPTLKTNGMYLTQYVFLRDFSRGEFIVFRTNATEDNNFYVKRVIGVGGDTIEVKKGVLYINDIPINEEYIKEKMLYKYPKMVIPENEYFVLGDNRNDSYDSKDWGTVKRDEILGVTLPISVKLYDLLLDPVFSRVSNVIGKYLIK